MKKEFDKWNKSIANHHQKQEERAEGIEKKEKKTTERIILSLNNSRFFVSACPRVKYIGCSLGTWSVIVKALPNSMSDY